MRKLPHPGLEIFEDPTLACLWLSPTQGHNVPTQSLCALYQIISGVTWIEE